MNSLVVDTSVWIEIFGNLKKSSHCLEFIKKSSQVYVPSIVIFEVTKKISKLISEQDAFETIAYLSRYKILDLTRDIAVEAASLALEFKLDMADAVVYAHALKTNSILVTLDNDFASLPHTKVVR